METRNKWNLKHKEHIKQFEGQTPNPRLINLSPHLNGGKALDLACGLGGNSFFLASLNYEVQAMDISDVAINFIKEQVLKNKFEVYPKVCDLTDMTELNLQDGTFDLVVITYYLDRMLFHTVRRVLKEKGYFFMETFYQSPHFKIRGVSNQYKLKTNELLTEFGDWKVLFFEENEHEGRQTLFCQKC